MVRPGASITGIVRSLARERQFATVAEQSLISAITKYRNTSLPLQTHIFRALSPMPVTTIRPRHEAKILRKRGMSVADERSVMRSIGRHFGFLGEDGLRLAAMPVPEERLVKAS